MTKNPKLSHPEYLDLNSDEDDFLGEDESTGGEEGKIDEMADNTFILTIVRVGVIASLEVVIRFGSRNPFTNMSLMSSS